MKGRILLMYKHNDKLIYIGRGENQWWRYDYSYRVYGEPFLNERKELVFMVVCDQAGGVTYLTIDEMQAYFESKRMSRIKKLKKLNLF